MTKPESLPVEEARKKFADILDGTQFRNTHTEITRRGKAAGVVVPPEWYDEAIEALAEKRRKTVGSPPPAAATPNRKVTQAAPKPEPIDLTGISPEVAALSMERVRSLSATAEARQPQWVAEIREEYPDVNELRLCYLIVDTGFRQGRKPPELADPPAGEPERPASSEETTT
jgi:prevent-host-death family protein